MVITEHQRRVLIDDAVASNWTENGPGPEALYADVIADLAMGRDVADRDLFVRFLWRRVTVAVDAGLSRKEHWVWSAAVVLLDQLGERLDDIFAGRSAAPGQEPRSATGVGSASLKPSCEATNPSRS